MDGPKVSTFGPNLTPLFLLKMIKIEKTNSSEEKNHLHDSWITSAKKVLVQIFFSFATINHRGHFRKVLNRIFKSGWFSWYHSYIV